MGQKPMLGLVGMFLAGLAITGCENSRPYTSSVGMSNGAYSTQGSTGYNRPAYTMSGQQQVYPSTMTAQPSTMQPSYGQSSAGIQQTGSTTTSTPMSSGSMPGYSSPAYGQGTPAYSGQPYNAGGNYGAAGSTAGQTSYGTQPMTGGSGQTSYGTQPMSGQPMTGGSGQTSYGTQPMNSQPMMGTNGQSSYGAQPVNAQPMGATQGYSNQASGIVNTPYGTLSASGTMPAYSSVPLASPQTYPGTTSTVGAASHASSTGTSAVYPGSAAISGASASPAAHQQMPVGTESSTTISPPPAYPSASLSSQTSVGTSAPQPPEAPANYRPQN